MSEIEITQADREAADRLVQTLDDTGRDWGIALTRLVDGVSEYTLTYHGEKSVHEDTDDAYQHLRELQEAEKSAAVIEYVQNIRHEARAEALEEAAKAIEGDGVVIPLATAFVPLIIGHNQPCMSGDMRDRLTLHKRRQFDDAVRDFATDIRALRSGEREEV